MWVLLIRFILPVKKKEAQIDELVCPRSHRVRNGVWTQMDWVHSLTEITRTPQSVWCSRFLNKKKKKTPKTHSVMFTWIPNVEDWTFNCFIRSLTLSAIVKNREGFVMLFLDWKWLCFHPNKWFIYITKISSISAGWSPVLCFQSMEIRCGYWG